MQPNQNNQSDLEYMAQMAFEKIDISESDLKEIRKEIKARTISYNNGYYFIFINLMIGVFLGITVFFCIYTSSNKLTSKAPIKTQAQIKRSAPPMILTLDTVQLLSDNFTRQTIIKHTNEDKNISTSYNDSSIIINSTPIAKIVKDTNFTNTEEQIIYTSNAPVIFIHDLKITNYSLLYFRQNKSIPLNTPNNIEPSFANKTDITKNDNLLRDRTNYYLHQVISKAMQHFSKKEFTDCLRELNIILAINPDDINCNFYSGMCLYYKHQFTKAIAYFDFCIGYPNNAFVNEAKYYKALSLFEAGYRKEANVLFNQIANENSFYSSKAKQMLE